MTKRTVWSVTATVICLTAASSFAEQVGTDKLNYFPGETVTITGKGWQPQEEVSMVIGNTEGTRPPFETRATAGTDGGFSNTSFIVQEIDRDKMLTLEAQGSSGAQAFIVFKDGVAPGALSCTGLAPFNPTHYGLPIGETARCTIVGATDLADPHNVEVLVKSSTLGNRPAEVISVDVSEIDKTATITFAWTAPANGCETSIVSYGPIRSCDTRGRCATFPTEGTDANNKYIAGGSGHAAAGFAYENPDGEVISCSAPPPELKVEANPKNGAFVQETQVTTTLVVSNPAAAGAGTATNVQLKDDLPGNGGLVWETATASQGTCTVASNTLNCSLGNIAPQKYVTVTVKSTERTPLPACQSQPNPAAIASADGGLIAQDSSSLTCTPSSPPQLAVVTTPDSGTFLQGGEASYTIVVSNPAAAGSAPASNVKLGDQLPGYGTLTWTSAETTAGSCSIANNYLSCLLGDIPPGKSVTVTAHTPAVTPLEACQDQPNPSAQATADGGLTAQDSGFITCLPPLPPQLQVQKSPDNGTFLQGGQLTSTIVVSNPAAAGSRAATEVQLSDPLPTSGGLNWTSVTMSQGACSITDNVLNCSLGTIPAGGSATVTVSTPAATPAAACVLQQSVATATAYGGLTSRDSGSHLCKALVAPRLAMTKRAHPMFSSPGQPVTYTYTVRNTGDVPLTDITVTDDNGTPNLASDDFSVGTIATLAAGGSATLQATAIPTNTSIAARLGSAGPFGFALLSLGGDASHASSGINCSSGIVEGDIGITSYGKFNNASACEANGNFLKAFNVTYTGSGKLSGSTMTYGAVMDTVGKDARDAAVFFAALPVTAELQSQFPANGSISGSRTVTGKPGINVVNLTGLTVNGTLTLTGPQGTQFVLNVAGNFDLHSGKIATAGGVGAYDVIYNITNSKATVKTAPGTTGVGILLAPYNAISGIESAFFYGEIIGGFNKVITLKSRTRVAHPAPPAPEVTNTATATAVYGGIPVSATAKATVYTHLFGPEPD